jgi:hypothetical protein
MRDLAVGEAVKARDGKKYLEFMLVAENEEGGCPPAALR